MDDTLPLVDSATLPDAEKKRLRNSTAGESSAPFIKTPEPLYPYRVFAFISVVNSI